MDMYNQDLDAIRVIRPTLSVHGYGNDRSPDARPNKPVKRQSPLLFSKIRNVVTKR